MALVFKDTGKLLKEKSKSDLNKNYDIRNGYKTNLQISKVYFLCIESTTPFIGLFGTVWGIMNSFPINCYLKKWR